MWLSLNIISKFVDINDINPEELSLKITMSSAEIESIDYMNHNYKTIFAAEIIKIDPHPDADKLTVVYVSTGDDKYQVVCGADNFKQNDIVAFASIGTEFAENFKIKKTKIRGIESSGMLCSEKELGISEDHSGILILPAGTKTGTLLNEIYPDYVDTRLEIDNKSITHRPDLWSHAGFAREIGALYKRQVKDVVDKTLVDDFSNSNKIKVVIENSDFCPRYSCLALKNIKIEESPQWLKALVTSIGMRPINNIVDVTNYVMAEIGEPMHAFDRKKLKGDKIIVRGANNGEILTTLDGQEFTLTTEDIVIADEGGTIALGGVMGGGNSEIEDNTTEIILEAANFNPVNIRKTSQKFGLRTEASMRFEKSLSPDLTEAAIIRCYDLIKQIIPEVETTSIMVDAFPKIPEKIKIETSTGFIRKKLGHDLEDNLIIDILSSLNFDITENNGSLVIDVPSYRATKDISIPDDIVEEVGRIYGYDNIPEKTVLVPCAPPEENNFRLFEREVKNILSYQNHMVEFSGYSFVGDDILNKLKINEEKELFLRNPLSMEQDRLRRSLIPDIINVIDINQKYQEEFAAYEVGRVYLKENRKSGKLAEERHMLTGVVFKKNPEDPIFFNAKHIIINLCKRLRVKKFELIYGTSNIPVYAHPGRCLTIKIDGKNAGIIFELHPTTVNTFDLNGSAGIFEIDLELLYESEKNDINFDELQKFPEVPFEISVLSNNQVYTEEICKIIQKSNTENIKNVDVISIYRGEQLPENYKSVSLKIIFSSQKKTLGPEEVDNLMKKVINDLDKNGFKLR